MKLYTEEQVRQAIKMADKYHYLLDSDESYIVNILESIEHQREIKLEKIIEILEKHQEWRRDQNVPPKTEMQSPIELGIAIDYAIKELKQSKNKKTYGGNK